jgi:hypothetical protein
MTRLFALVTATFALVIAAAVWASPDRSAESTILVIVDLTPATATNDVGTQHTVTATVTDASLPLQGVTVVFTITLGPNAGAPVNVQTDVNGEASFTYSSNGTAGQDTIEACVFSLPGARAIAGGLPLACDTATKDWVQPTATPSPSPTPTPGATLAAGTATPAASPTAVPAELPGTGGSAEKPGNARPLAAIALLGVLISACAVGTAALRRAR